jgi:hypothetical protein
MPADKSLFQSRRQLANLQMVSPEKKRFRLGRIFRFKKNDDNNTEQKRAKSPNPLFANKKRATITSVLTIAIISVGAFGYYEYLQSQNPAVIYAHKLNTLTNAVSQQITLPQSETPVVATVTDVAHLPKEAFFKDAQEGDKILLYKKDKEAILYRPSTGKVITYAELDFEDVVPTQEPAVAGASTSADVINGTYTIISVAPATQSAVPTNYIPEGKILIRPQ